MNPQHPIQNVPKCLIARPDPMLPERPMLAKRHIHRIHQAMRGGSPFENDF